jgi:hypothetical protein
MLTKYADENAGDNSIHSHVTGKVITFSAFVGHWREDGVDGSAYITTN